MPQLERVDPVDFTTTAPISEAAEMLERKLHAQHEMQFALEKMEALQLLNPEGHKLRIELPKQIKYLENEIKALWNGEGPPPPTTTESLLMNHWISNRPITHERVEFRVNQLRDRLQSENNLSQALLAYDPEHEIKTGEQLKNQEKWKSDDCNWQIMLAESKGRLTVEALRQFESYVPLSIIPEKSFTSEPLTGKFFIKVKDIHLNEDANETLVIQILVDNKMSKPMKLKRKGGPCELNTVGYEVDCKQAHWLEILIFDKNTILVGFIFFRLSWLNDYMDQQFNRKLVERLEIVPFIGVIDLEIAKPSPKESKNDVIEIRKISRQPVIMKKVYPQLGHEFISDVQGSLLLKCAHCSDLIYTTVSTFCRKCRLTCHKDCIKDIYIGCIASPNFKQWEGITKALLKNSKAHKLELVSVRTPCFCAHCGHLIPITTSSTESYRCATCGVHTHEECETYLPSFCGLTRENALRIARVFDNKNCAIGTQSKLRITTASNGAGDDDDNSKIWPIFHEEQFEFLTVIGKGNFGKVMLSRFKESGQLYALKILKKSHIIENDERESILAERNVFSIIHRESSPFLVSCCGIFQNDTRLFFVMEFVGGGDLMFHIQRRRFNEEQAKFFAAEVLLALEFLHRRSIIYRDLKLDNILLSLDGHIKLADYGLCKAGMNREATTSTFCGTPEFMAPEIIQEKPYTQSVDWWAFGVLLFELLFSQAPFHGRNEQEIFKAILTARITFPKPISPEAQDIIQRLLVRNPNLRLGSGGKQGGVEEIKKHSFFASVDFTKLMARKIDPPFKPTLVSPVDVSNFDREFTATAPLLTPSPSSKSHLNYDNFFDLVTSGTSTINI